ncbi:MAG: FAD-dependent oxidoreductase [Candidatus Bathyarchaeia archaeon]|jgi:protoporphyrinogen oxidase|nr:FAD-dependent oxidoreductase [Candidatus Bathyarchaeota archaeon A05DMB-4]MDH7595135.1 FAD-dependent oxidoreductase [Candidatus Bathyarchaeota archaeon]
MTKALVLGGGLSGLAAAYTLTKNEISSLLLERDETLGGLASSYLIDGSYVPKTYHHVMYGDAATLKIIRDLNLEKDLYWRKLKVGFYSKNKFYDFSSSISILKFKPISMWGRVKFGLLVLRARRKSNWQELDGVNVEDYCLKTTGKEAYKLINYIVQAKFAEPSNNVSAAWLMSRFGHESKSVSDQFGYLKGGIEQIIQGLAVRCAKKGTIKTNAKVTRINVKRGKVDKVEYEENGQIKEVEPNIVISTLPVPVLLKVAEDLPDEYRRSLENIRYKASLCAAVGLSRRVSPFYWLNVMDLDRHPFVGVFEHGHLNTELKYPSVMFVVKYLNSTDSFWQKPDQEIIEEFLSHLNEVFDCDVKEHLLWWRLHRAEYSTPLFTPNYSKFMPETKSPVEGLYVGGISQTYPRDRYMGTALQTGMAVAEKVLAEYRT